MSSRKNLINALKVVFQSRAMIISGFSFFTLSMGMYIFAILQTGTFESFFELTPFPILLAQIVLSLLNSILIAIALTFFIYVFRKANEHSELSFLSVISALFLSVASTGCYVCGTVLLPFLGVAASFAALPFGGLEIKFLTVFLLLYSINDLSQKVLGICKYSSDKMYSVKFGQRAFKIRGALLAQLKPIVITIVFLILILTLPVLIPDSLKQEVNASNSCNHIYEKE